MSTTLTYARVVVDFNFDPLDAGGVQEARRVLPPVCPDCSRKFGSQKGLNAHRGARGSCPGMRKRGSDS